VQTPADYVREQRSRAARRARQEARGRSPHGAERHRAEFGCSGSVLWRSGAARPPLALTAQNAITVLATRPITGGARICSAGVLFALKMLERATSSSPICGSSWGGAWGSRSSCHRSSTNTPRFDAMAEGIWNSCAGCAGVRQRAARRQGLAARHALGLRVRTPRDVDCTTGVPEVTQPVSEWLQRGYVPAHGRRPSLDRNEHTGLTAAAGRHYGPAFLTRRIIT